MIQVYEGDGITDAERRRGMPIWGVAYDGHYVQAIRPSSGEMILVDDPALVDGVDYDRAKQSIITLRRIAALTIERFLLLKVVRLQ